MKGLGFKTQLILSTTIMFTLALSIIGLVALSTVQEQVKIRVKNDLQHTLDIESQKIQNNFNITVNTVTGLAKIFDDGSIVQPYEQLLAYTVNITQVYKLTLGYEDGSSYASRSSGSFPDGIGLLDKYDPRTRPWYQLGTRSGGLAITDVFFTQSTGMPMVGVVHTVKDGVLLADIRLNNLQGQLEEVTSVTEGATALIIDTKGSVLASTFNGIEIKDQLQQSSLSEFRLGQDRYLELHVEGSDYVVVADSLALADKSLHMVLLLDKNLAYTDITNATMKIVTMLVISIIIGVAIIYTLLNYLYRPITSLRSLILNLASGNADLTQRLAVKTKDDIGQSAQGVNAFIEKIQTMMLKVDDATKDLSGGVNQLQTRSAESKELVNYSH